MPPRSRRGGLGAVNPFDQVQPQAEAPAAPVVEPIIPTGPRLVPVPEPAPADRSSTAPTNSKRIPRSKRQITAYMDARVINDARNAVLALRANPAGHRSLSALVEESIRREVRRLQDEHNGGRAFPTREVELYAGQMAGAVVRAAAGAKKRLTVYIDAAVDDDARNAVLALSTAPEDANVPASLSALVEDAIRREVDGLQRELHGGKPFPTRAARLPAGRPGNLVNHPIN